MFSILQMVSFLNKSLEFKLGSLGFYKELNSHVTLPTIRH